MKKILIIVLLCLVTISGFAQKDTIYQYTYGGIQDDVCNQVKATSDRGYIMIGTTNSFGHGATDFYAVKVDSNGKHQWSNTYGGPLADEGFSVVQTLDKGYAFVGYTENTVPGNGYDVLLVRTDSSGKELWQKNYGGSDWDFGYSISQVKDSGFVICGQTYSYGAGNGDVYVIRTDKNGDTLWTRTVGGPGYDIGNSLYVREDSLYIIAGATTSFGKGDTNMFLIQMNNNGVMEHDTTFGGPATINVFNSVKETGDGEYIMTGYSDSVSPGRDYALVVKTDSAFREKWMFNSTYASGMGIGKDLAECTDGTLIFVGTSNTDGNGGYATYILHLNMNPFFAWFLNGEFEGGTGDEQGNSCVFNPVNNHVAFAGATNSPGYTEGLNDFYLILFKNDSDIIQDASLIHELKLYMDTMTFTSIAEQSNIPVMAKVFPNPMASEATVIVQGELEGKYTFSLFDIAGQCIINNMEMEHAGHGQFITHFLKGDLQQGMYFYRIQAGDNKAATGKIIVE